MWMWLLFETSHSTWDPSLQDGCLEKTSSLCFKCITFRHNASTWFRGIPQFDLNFQAALVCIPVQIGRLPLNWAPRVCFHTCSRCKKVNLGKFVLKKHDKLSTFITALALTVCLIWLKYLEQLDFYYFAKDWSQVVALCWSSTALVCIFAGYRMQQDHSCIVVAKIHQNIHEAYEQKFRSCSGLALWCLQSCSIFLNIWRWLHHTPPPFMIGMHGPVALPLSQRELPSLSVPNYPFSQRSRETNERRFGKECWTSKKGALDPLALLDRRCWIIQVNETYWNNWWTPYGWVWDAWKWS